MYQSFYGLKENVHHYKRYLQIVAILASFFKMLLYSIFVFFKLT